VTPTHAIPFFDFLLYSLLSFLLSEKLYFAKPHLFELRDKTELNPTSLGRLEKLVKFFLTFSVTLDQNSHETKLN